MDKKRKTKAHVIQKPFGPYSQAMRAGNFIFCSGQIAPEGGIVEQTKNAIEKLKNILANEGRTLQDVVKTEIYMKDLADYSKMNETYAEAFSFEPKPARVTVEVSKLPQNALIEISCVAYEKNHEK